MKATGVVRKVDELGRIVIPIELRRTLGIDVKDPLEIFIDKDMIVLRKYEPFCIFCTGNDVLKEYEGKRVCIHCRTRLSKDDK